MEGLEAISRAKRSTRIGLRTCALCAALTAAAASPARAQGDAAIRGQATAAADGSAIAGAAVVLAPVPPGMAVQATADTDGRFVFPNVRPGEYILSGSAPGFSSRDVHVAVQPRDIRIVALSLELQRVEVGVQVTAGSAALTSAPSPTSTLLSAERLEALPVWQQHSLTDAIVTLAPGMIRGHDDFVHIRGHEIALNPSINGVSFWENPHAVFSAGVSAEIVDSATVMTGGFSAEYGNRFGGVIEVVTKSGLARGNGGGLTVNAGQAGRRSVSGEVSGRRGEFGYYVFGSALESDRFLSPPDPVAVHDHARAGHLFAQADANFGRAGSLRIVVMGDGTSFEIPKTPLDESLRPLANAEQRNRQQTAIAGWTGSAADFALSASFYQRWSKSQLIPASGPLTAIAGLTRELNTAGGKVDATRFAGRHAVKMGFDAVSLRPEETLSYDASGYVVLTHLLALPHIHFPTTALNFSGRSSGYQLSGYARDAIQAGRATVDAGVRVDRYDLVVSSLHLSPRINVSVGVAGGAVLHASYNHFFVPPAVEGVLSSSAGLTAHIEEIGRPLPPLEPTIEDQFEVGASLPLSAMRWSVTGYFRATENPVHTTVWPDARIYSYASFDRERAYGLETKIVLPRLAGYGVDGYLNYALGRVDFYNPITGGFTTEAGHLGETNRFLAPMDQTHTFSAGATYAHSPTGIWLGTALEYGSGTPMGHGGGAHEHAPGTPAHEHAVSAGAAPRVPEHFTANLSAGINLLTDGRRRSRLLLRLDIENIADNVYVIAREGEFSPAQYATPRLISATARIRF